MDKQIYNLAAKKITQFLVKKLGSDKSIYLGSYEGKAMVVIKNINGETSNPVKFSDFIKKVVGIDFSFMDSKIEALNDKLGQEIGDNVYLISTDGEKSYVSDAEGYKKSIEDYIGEM